MSSEEQCNSKSCNDMKMDTAQRLAGVDKSNEEDGWRTCNDIYIPPASFVFGERETQGPRLMINKIIASNFKTFGEKLRIGPLHKCLSVISGHQESGRRDILDALLFVLGYNSYQGEPKHKTSLATSTITVHFHQILDQPGEECNVVRGSNFVISRTILEDSSTYYKLNGKKVEPEKIAKLLQSHNVDLHHNICFMRKGELEKVALMKVKGLNEEDIDMLEYLEEIIGTTRYKEPLKKLFKKVQLLSKLQEEKLKRLNEVEKARTDLEKPMQEAVGYLKLKNTIFELQHKLFRCKRREISDELAKEERKKELEAKEEVDSDREMSEKDKILENLRAELLEITTAIHLIELEDIASQEKEALTDLTEEELQELSSQLAEATKQLPEEIPNTAIIEQYRQQNELHRKLCEEMSKIREEKNLAHCSYEQVMRNWAQELKAALRQISEKLKEIYKTISLGGEAELTLDSSKGALAYKLSFSVCPPEKSWQYIQNLSKSEQTLSCLALILALHCFKPAPVYFVDDIDAAIDSKNVSAVVNYIKKRMNAQFIAVSNMFEMIQECHHLIRVFRMFDSSICIQRDNIQSRHEQRISSESTSNENQSNNNRGAVSSPQAATGADQAAQNKRKNVDKLRVRRNATKQRKINYPKNIALEIKQIIESIVECPGELTNQMDHLKDAYETLEQISKSPPTQPCYSIPQDLQMCYWSLDRLKTRKNYYVGLDPYVVMNMEKALEKAIEGLNCANDQMLWDKSYVKEESFIDCLMMFDKYFPSFF